MQSLIRSKSAGVTGGRGTAGAGPGRDLLYLFTGVPARCVVLRVRCPGPIGSCARVCPLSVLCCVCSVLGHLAPVYRCEGSSCCAVCALCWATWLLFTGVSARCVVLRVRCPGPLGCCSPVCPLGVLCCVCGVLGHSAPVHWCARPVRCVARAASWATWLLFTGVIARRVVSRVRCLGPLGSCSLVRPLGVLCCMCGVLGHLAPVHRCAHSVRCVACVPLGHLAPVHGCAPSVCCVACAVSWATWLLFTGAHARCVVLCVRSPGPLFSCSPVCPHGALSCMRSLLGHLAIVHRFARPWCCAACAVSWATWPLLTAVPARHVMLRVLCPGPLGSCSPPCSIGALCCVCGVLGHLALVDWCARSVRCVACVVSWATWLLCTGVPPRCVVFCVRCPGPLGSCSPVHTLGVLCCVCGILGHSAPVHRCARSGDSLACAVSWATWLLFTGVPARGVVLSFGVLGHLAAVHHCARSACCVVCAVFWATWLLFTGVPAPCVVLRVHCPGPLGSCSPVCTLGVLYCVFGVLGHLAPVQRCDRSAWCVACAVSWATWLLFTIVPARRVVLFLRCSGQLGSCSLVCPLGALCCVCTVLGHLAPVHRCARSVCCIACSVSWATWLLFTIVPARRVVLFVRCSGPLGSCSPVCPLGALCCVCTVLGNLDPVHRCARSVCCIACSVSWATWLRFSGLIARRGVSRSRCPGPLGSCSPVCPLVVLCCMCGVLGHLAPVHQSARCVRCVVCAVYWATWLLFTGVIARRVVSRARCPGPLGSCSPVCPLGVLCCMCDVRGQLAPAQRCARSVRGVACVVSSATCLLCTSVPARCAVLRL